MWLDGRIRQLIKELDIREREDILVVNNYFFPPEMAAESGKVALNQLLQMRTENN